MATTLLCGVDYMYQSHEKVFWQECVLKVGPPIWYNLKDGQNKDSPWSSRLGVAWDANNFTLENNVC